MLVENLPVPLDRRTWQEALALTEAGWDVTVIGPQGGGRMRKLSETIDGVRVLRYPQKAARSLSGYLLEYVPSLLFTALWFARARAGGRIEVVHACNPPDVFWPFGRVARLWGGAFVFDQHDANPELAATKWGRHGRLGRWLVRMTTWLERQSYRSAALVLSPNESYRDLAIARGGVDPDRVVVVRNAPDVASYRALARSVRVEPHRVGYVGVMGSQDGLGLLIDAWNIVVQQPDMGDAVLELVGDGEARPELEAQVDRMNLRQSVRFRGYLPPEEFVPLLAACAVCVSPDPPTPFNDVSTMVKVIDYLAIGRGIVAFNLAETGRLAGEAAILVDDVTPTALASAIDRVLSDEALSARLQELADQRLDELAVSWEASAERLTDAYRSLARPRHAAAD